MILMNQNCQWPMTTPFWFENWQFQTPLNQTTVASYVLELLLLTNFSVYTWRCKVCGEFSVTSTIFWNKRAHKAQKFFCWCFFPQKHEKFLKRTFSTVQKCKNVFIIKYFVYRKIHIITGYYRFYSFLQPQIRLNC